MLECKELQIDFVGQAGALFLEVEDENSKQGSWDYKLL